MIEKKEPDGTLTALGRAADESLEIAAAIREGRLTRPQFDAWYAKRRSEGSRVVISLREKVAVLAEPVGAAIVRGEEMLGWAPRGPKHSPRRRHARRAAARAPGSPDRGVKPR